MTTNVLFIKFSLSFPSHPQEITISIEIVSGKPNETQSSVLYSPYPDIHPIEPLIVTKLMTLKEEAEYILPCFSDIRKSNTP